MYIPVINTQLQYKPAALSGLNFPAQTHRFLFVYKMEVNNMENIMIAVMVVIVVGAGVLSWWFENR